MSNFSVSQYRRCSRRRVVLMAFIVSLFCLHPVWADDTEIYFNSNVSDASKTNLLFVLDASNSMTTKDCLDGSKIAFQPNKTCNDGSPNGENSRLDRMIAAMDQVLDNLSDDFNVGLMRFGGFDGGRVIFPITDLSTPGVRDEIKAVIDDMELVTGTPSVGALEEAWRYYTGQPVAHGKTRAITNEARSAKSSRVSHPDSYTGGQVVGRSDTCNDNLNSADCEDEKIIDHPELGPPIYKSPIVSKCQANHAILLTDGAPWLGPGNFDKPYFQGTIDTIVGLSRDIREGPNAVVIPAWQKNKQDASNGHCRRRDNASLCGEEIAWYLSRNDQSPLPDVQTIVTHAIGFNVQHDWLRDVSIAGNGNYIEAESSLELIAAIDTITSSASDAGVSIVAPVVTIDQFTRLSHREELYLALFKPLGTANWAGNLKKYKFDGVLKDAAGNVAVDPDTGELLASSKSFWSDQADGDNVLLGGAAEKLDMNSRKMYSYLEVGNNDLTAAGNRMNSTVNTDFAPELIGASDDGVRDFYLDWLAGRDVLDEDRDGSDTDQRRHLGDPLHSNPTVVSYGLGVKNDGSADKENLDSLIFFGTNEGFLHAIDTTTGEEEYAFMPPELLSKVPELFANSGLVDSIDGQAGLSPLPLSNARQSSTGFGGEASRAIDGNVSGVYSDNSVTHTAFQDQSWWEADLGASATIAEIEIWNRTDRCCTARLSDYSVFVSNTPFSDSDTPDNLLNDPNVWSQSIQGELERRVITVGAVGRYVRVQQNGSSGDALSLAEVRVNGLDENRGGSGNKIYGMDGNITLRTIDTNNDGFIDATADDKAYLYAGMRRGGRNYYALDVSKKSEPEFLWSINGGTGDFAELSQSWSKPIVTQLKVDSEVKDVLVFAGGYDVLQDFKLTRGPDNKGRAIYIVDADTGELVWSGGHPSSQPAGSDKHYAYPDMLYSIPADLSVVADPSTGYMSQIYVGDMGGKLWRFDINNGGDVTDLVEGGVIGDFGEDGSEAGARRFFASPDLSLQKGDDGEQIMNIAVGTGYRAHPLNMAINDMFLVLQYPFEGYDSGYVVTTVDDLYDATQNVIGEGTDVEITDAREALADANGWYISMEDAGEKVLDTSTSFQGVVRFVSYVPVNSTNPCDPGLGNSFFYAVNLADGTPFEELNKDELEPFRKEFRRKEIKAPGISPPVSTIFVESEGSNGKITPTDVSGAEKILEWEDVSQPRRWFWAESPE